MESSERKIIVVTGPSAGSMKSTTADLLQDTRCAQRLRGDGFYHGLESVPMVDGMHNWEDSRAFDLVGLSYVVRALKKGVSYVELPAYSRQQHARIGVEKFEPDAVVGKRILLDSIFGFHDPVRQYADLKVFIDPEESLILERRRMRQGSSYTDEYHEKIMLPSVREMRPIWQKHADVVISVSHDMSSADIAAQLAVEIERRFPR